MSQNTSKTLDELAALARAKREKAANEKAAEIAARNAERQAKKDLAHEFLGAELPDELRVKVFHADVTDMVMSIAAKIFNSGNVGWWGQGYFTLKGKNFKIQVTITEQ